jgi:hypothetical protein
VAHCACNLSNVIPVTDEEFPAVYAGGRSRLTSRRENGFAEFVSVHVESFVSLGYAWSSIEVLRIGIRETKT